MNGIAREAARDPEILLVGSSGGHLAQLIALRAWWDRYSTLWVSFDTPDATEKLKDQSVVWAYHPTTRNLLNLFRNLFLAFRTFRRSRPRIVVSTGAGVAFPFFLVAWMYRVPTCYVEVYDRIDSRTLTGRLCKPFSTLFLVQWEEQEELYPGSIVIGPLL